MTRRHLSGIVVCIVVFGHVAILAYTAVVLVTGAGVLNAIQIIQIFLVGSPILAVAAYSGVTYLFSPEPPASQQQPKASGVLVLVTIGIPSLLVTALVVTYSIAFFAYRDLAPISIILGLTETSLGAYIGVIRDRLFSNKEDS